MAFKNLVQFISELVADSIIGAFFATSADGLRVVIRNAGSGGIVELYSFDDQTPGSLVAAPSFDSKPQVFLRSGYADADDTTYNSQLQLSSGPPTGLTDGRKAAFNGAVTIAGSLDIGGLAPGEVAGSQAQTVVGMTNATGNLTVLFPSAFPSTPIVVAMGANGEVMYISANLINQFGFTITARNGITYALINAGLIRVNYIAMLPHG